MSRMWEHLAIYGMARMTLAAALGWEITWSSIIVVGIIAVSALIFDSLWPST